MNSLTNYLVKGTYSLRFGIRAGVLTYLFLFAVLCIIPARRKVTFKNLAELLLACCTAAILSVTGLFSLNFASSEGFTRFANVGLIPFLGSSLIPMFLNFLLFVPFGFLLPFVFQKTNWKRSLLFGFCFSLFIELLQLFGGRYAELEDIILNSLGALTGYLFCRALHSCKSNIQKGILSILFLLAAVGALFGLLYFACDQTPSEPENSIDSIVDNVAQCSFLHDGKTIDFSIADGPFNMLISMLQNGGGHIFDTESVNASKVILPENYCIEIILKESQSITVSNDGQLMIEAANRLLFDATENILYWGCDTYEYAVSYTRFDETLQSHTEEILAEYGQLCQIVAERFDE